MGPERGRIVGGVVVLGGKRRHRRERCCGYIGTGLLVLGVLISSAHNSAVRRKHTPLEARHRS